MAVQTGELRIWRQSGREPEETVSTDEERNLQTESDAESIHSERRKRKDETIRDILL